MNRKSWLSIIARAKPEALLEHWYHCAIEVEHTWLRAPETGLLPLQARMGNTGDTFLFGDATITRAVVKVNDKTGYAFVRGRHKEHARCAALIDALMQIPDYQQPLITNLLLPLEKLIKHQESDQAKSVKATTVDFFTMVRGE